MTPHALIDLPDDVINEIHLEIPEANIASITHFLRRAVIEFCEKSHYWQEDIGPVTVGEDVTEYDLPVSNSFSLVSVMKVFFLDVMGNEVRLSPAQSGNSESPDLKYRYWQPTPFTLCFYPYDELIDKEISIVAAIKPELYNNSFKFSDYIIKDFREAIIAKAKACLYKIPRKEWTDINEARLNESIFMEKTREALRRQNAGYSSIPYRGEKKIRLYY
jgi:hypothetical protein